MDRVPIFGHEGRAAKRVKHDEVRKEVLEKPRAPARHVPPPSRSRTWNMKRSKRRTRASGHVLVSNRAEEVKRVKWMKWLDQQQHEDCDMLMEMACTDVFDECHELDGESEPESQDIEDKALVGRRHRRAGVLG